MFVPPASPSARCWSAVIYGIWNGGHVKAYVCIHYFGYLSLTVASLCAHDMDISGLLGILTHPPAQTRRQPFPSTAPDVRKPRCHSWQLSWLAPVTGTVGGDAFCALISPQAHSEWLAAHSLVSLAVQVQRAIPVAEILALASALGVDDLQCMPVVVALHGG